MSTGHWNLNSTTLLLLGTLVKLLKYSSLSGLQIFTLYTWCAVLVKCKVLSTVLDMQSMSNSYNYYYCNIKWKGCEDVKGPLTVRRRKKAKHVQGKMHLNVSFCCGSHSHHRYSAAGFYSQESLHRACRYSKRLFFFW